MSGPSVVIDRVVKKYGEARALGDVSMTAAAGSFTAIVGQSGSGKSTLLKTINRLVDPTRGAVRVGGRDVRKSDPVMLRRSIGYVFQNIGLFPHMDVAENIAIGPRIAGGEPADVAALLDLVGLPADYAGRMPGELSGGEAQRVGVARALAGGAKLLLMDEPFGALDPVTRDALGKAVRKLHDDLGLTTLMVTHDMAEALLLADRVVVMRKGMIVADATPADILAGKAGRHATALVEVPLGQVERLIALRDGATA
ncbi:ATP-binding cassette domain-containing protein [Sphingomonas naphthae]|uniref:ATP-binding cassette domain-containing protein n=1 Tax=Sphingomonas naphthae TaxID=1813468 RepID=A0ABY7TKW5_9SPHN|nr:ATP-binding cassette domain-containing protein [Sphingomonas naphthae]WCT73015.1 ATP-binding cassette domain-containing protein [Sphingomonas naphthae]